MILFDTVCRLVEFESTDNDYDFSFEHKLFSFSFFYDNLTKTNFRSMRILIRTKILIYDNLTKTNFHSMRIFLRTKILIYDVLIINDKSNCSVRNQIWTNVQGRIKLFIDKSNSDLLP